MRFPHPSEIHQMRQRGYDHSTIEREEARCQAAEEVRASIKEAFNNVSLGAGIGLHEGQAIDGCSDEAARARARARDEFDNWTEIPRERLRSCHSSLSFFDAEGMRFHLPAFMLAELDGEFGQGLIYNLTRVTDYAQYYELLSRSQRAAVRSFLALASSEPGYDSDREHIHKAINGYWHPSVSDRADR